VKIVLLTQYYPPEVGAPQARLSHLARVLVERGHEVTVLTAMPNYPQGRIYPGYGGFFRQEWDAGVRIIRTGIYPTKRLDLFRRLLSYFSFMLSSVLIGGWHVGRADFLMTESPPIFLGISGYLLSRWKRARWIFNVSDLWPESAVRLGIARRGLALRLGVALESFCYRHAWLTTGQSRSILQSIHERFPDVQTFHFSNGVETERFRPDCAPTDSRRALANGAGCVAVYAGLHGLAQNLFQVLEAAELLQDLTDFRVVLIGDGPEKEQLVLRARAKAITNVSFLDTVPASSAPALLGAADIFIVPLKTHLPGAVPSKLYEAMALGRPVVLSAEGEAAEIVRSSEAGIVVSPGDACALAGALRYLATNGAERARMGEAGRRAVMASFDRKRILDNFVEFLEMRQ